MYFKKTFVETLRDYFRAKQQALEEDTYKRGYDFAAGALLRNEKTVAELEALSDGPFGDVSSSFDQGIRDAIKEYQKFVRDQALMFQYKDFVLSLDEAYKRLNNNLLLTTRDFQ